MTTASALETCISVARIIADARRFIKWSRLESCVRNRFNSDSVICILVCSSHAECGDRCQKPQPLEVWTIKCTPSMGNAGMEIDGFFLASAIRSQLHFSPLNSWLSRDLLPAGIELIASVESPKMVEKILQFLPDLHQFPSTKPIDGIQCSVSVRFIRGTTMPQPVDMCSLMIETALSGSPSNTPSGGSPIDAPVFPLSFSVQNLQLDPAKQKCTTPVLNDVTMLPPRILNNTKHELTANWWVEEILTRKKKLFSNISRPDSLSLLATPMETSANRETKSVSSDARRILFSDVLEASSPRPLPSPFSRFLQVSQPKQIVSDNHIMTADARTSRSTQRSPLFNRMGLPIYSSPAPPIELRRRKIRNSICLEGEGSEFEEAKEAGRLATSAPTSRSLLCNFEESALHCRLDPLTEVQGFTGHLVASNTAIPAVELCLPVRTFFFDSGSDTAPSPYLGVCSLEEVTKRGLIIPSTGTLQFTLLNPQGTVIRMFVQRYDFTDLRPKASTFLRQRTFFMRNGADFEESGKMLRYLIHFKIRADKSGRTRLHGDIRMLFAPNNTIDALNIDPVEEGGAYVFRSFTETPKLTKFP